MTKTNYEAIAELYYKQYAFLTKKMWEAKDNGDEARAKRFWDEIENTKSLMFDIIQVFRQSNPKFDFWRFIAIVGLNPEGHWRQR